jgi:ribosomal protein S18 acetylase RimI-like enzyme
MDLNLSIPIGYAHIDFDDNKYWFGICILENYQNKGYGKEIMTYIFNQEKIKQLDQIYLTVDKINAAAIHLYKKFNFDVIHETDTYFMMRFTS